MDSFVLSAIKEGKDVNEVLNFPYAYMIDLLHEQNKPKQTQSLIAAFGGG